MAEIPAGLRVKRSATPLRPNAVTDLVFTQTTQTTDTFTWAAPSVPGGGTPITFYKVFKDGVHVATINVPNARQYTGINLTPGDSTLWGVEAWNSFGGSPRYEESHSTTGTGSVTSPPTMSAFTGATNTTGVAHWTKAADDPISPTLGFHIWKVGASTWQKEVADPTATSTVVGNQTPGTDQDYYVTQYNGVGDSNPSSAQTLTTTGTPPNPGIRADDVLDYSGLNVKPSYGTGTVYGYNQGGTTYETTDALAARMIEYGGRFWRERINISGGAGAQGAKTKQKRMFTACIAQGIKWLCGVGVLKDYNGMSAADVRTNARADVKAMLDVMRAEYKPLCPGGVLANGFVALTGPNEVDNPGNNTDLWFRNAQIFQEELWNYARVPTVSSPAVVADFAAIPIAAASTRHDNYLLRSKRLGSTKRPDLVQPGTWSDPPLSAPFEYKGWNDMGNPHRYAAGTSDPGQFSDMLDTIAPFTDLTSNRPIFSETGYNHSGWNNDDSYKGVITNGGGLSVPRWVAATYAPRMLLNLFLIDAGWCKFEMLDDEDASKQDRESHFGLIKMTGTTVAGCRPSTWEPGPEFYAMKRLHAILKDTDKNFTPTALSYTMPNQGTAGANLKRLAVEKKNGDRWLFLWRDIDCWNPNTNNGNGGGNQITTTSMDFSIQFPVSRQVTIYQPNDATAADPVGSTAATVQAQGAVVAQQTLGANTPLTVPLRNNLKAVLIQ